jgi:hypothetical protein
MAAARRDGVLSGVLSTRTSGLVRLPRRFRGDPAIVEAFTAGRQSVRSLFDEMFPPAELALLAADGELLGVGIGELIPVVGRDFPVFCRLDPQFLLYLWSENRWYYNSVVGRLPITPGDGRWMLHTPGGRIAPWNNGLWRALGRSYIRKDHANWHRDNWEAKLAHPARIAFAPAGSTEPQKDSLFRALLGWGINTVLGLPVGYDCKLLESNGRGADSFVQTIADQNNEILITIAGQTVSTEGGKGFSSTDLHRTIRADLIQATADSLAYTLNTQGIPVFTALRYGPEAVLTRPCIMEYDTLPAKDKNAEALTLNTVAQAISQLTTSLTGSSETLDISAICEDFAVPVVAKPEPVAAGGLRLVGGTDVDSADGDAGAGAATDGGADVAVDTAASGKPAQDSALNGAQVTSLVGIVTSVVLGQLPRDAAIAIMQRAFLVDEDEAAAMLGSAGLEPTPAASLPTSPAAPPSSGAPEAPPAKGAAA